jgi:hypothetical protein
MGKSLFLLGLCLCAWSFSVDARTKPAGVPDTLVFVPTTNQYSTFLDALQQAAIGPQIQFTGVSQFTRVLNFIGFAAYEALAPFTATLKGPVLAGPPAPPNTALADALRVPAQQRTDHNKRIAISYAVYRVLDLAWRRTSFPFIEDYMKSEGLYPVSTSQDLTTPEGIGNIVGQSVVQWFLADAANQMGNRVSPLRTVDFNMEQNRFYDWTLYSPINTPSSVKNAGRYMPLHAFNLNGIFTQGSTRHYGRATLLCGRQQSSFNTSLMPKGYTANLAKAFKTQMQAVINASANLDDVKKCTAETADSLLVEFGRINIVNNNNLQSVDQQVMLLFAYVTSIYDGEFLAAYWKYVFDSARPITGIRYGKFWNAGFRAWGGPRKGTVNMKPFEFRPFMTSTHPHPDIPSGLVTTFASIATLVKKLITKPTNPDPQLGWIVTCPKGWSQVEPDFAPSANTTIPIISFQDGINFMKNARHWSGIHTPLAADVGEQLGKQLGDALYNTFVTKYGWACPPGKGGSLLACDP